MTRILFYAPLKPPTHPVPSGDRTMARLLMLALKQGGFEVELASRLRARIADPDEVLVQETLRARAWGVADRMIAKLRAGPKRARPKAFFTYHLYYKAVDWIGPRVADALDIPYLVAEASHAPKRAAGAWAFNHAGAEAAIKAADAIFCFNPVGPGMPSADRRPARAGGSAAVPRSAKLRACPARTHGGAREVRAVPQARCPAAMAARRRHDAQGRQARLLPGPGGGLAPRQADAAAAAGRGRRRGESRGPARVPRCAVRGAVSRRAGAGRI